MTDNTPQMGTQDPDRLGIKAIVNAGFGVLAQIPGVVKAAWDSTTLEATKGSGGKHPSKLTWLVTIKDEVGRVGRASGLTLRSAFDGAWTAAIGDDVHLPCPSEKFAPVPDPLALKATLPDGWELVRHDRGLVIATDGAMNLVADWQGWPKVPIPRWFVSLWVNGDRVAIGKSDKDLVTALTGPHDYCLLGNVRIIVADSKAGPEPAQLDLVDPEPRIPRRWDTDDMQVGAILSLTEGLEILADHVTAGAWVQALDGIGAMVMHLDQIRGEIAQRQSAQLAQLAQTENARGARAGRCRPADETDVPEVDP